MADVRQLASESLEGSMPEDQLFITDAPEIAELSFRHFRGPSDYPPLVAILTASDRVDRIERQVTLEQVSTGYQHLTNCDPFQDMIVAQVADEVVGYSRGEWLDESPTGLLYEPIGAVTPAWRRRGIGRALLLWTERRLRAVATTHPAGQAKYLHLNVGQYQDGKARMLERAGYRPTRFFHQMVRPTLDEIPELPLPPGVEVRPVLPEHYRAIWQAIDETGKDEWGYTLPTEDRYQAWVAHEHFQPHLWQAAWDAATGQIVGHVLTYVDGEENAQLGRQRGHTEGIGVIRAWRRRGLARALIARSLLAQKSAGMSESALVVDSENTSGATRLYENCGFELVRRECIYRKSL